MNSLVLGLFYFVIFALVFICVACLVYRKGGIMSYLSSSAFHYVRYVSYLQRYFGKPKLPSHLSRIPNIEKVSDRVYRILGQNPGYHTLQGTNTYLVTGISSNEHVLIDTGEALTSKEYIKILFDEVFPATKTKRLSMILLTHGHYDHLGGVLAILTELRNRNMLPLPLIYKKNVMFGKYPAKGFDCLNIDEEQMFQVDDQTTLQAIATPGHTDDHVCFLLHEDRALFTGDCILGCGSAVFDDLSDYMKSLNKLKHHVIESKIDDEENYIDKLYPGHGPVIYEKAIDKIIEYIEHRLTREKEIVDVLSKISNDAHEKQGNLRNQKKSNWISSLSMVPLVYGKTLPPAVILSAQSNLLHHLTKLEKDGMVEKKFPDSWKLNEVDGGGNNGNEETKKEK
jgi:ribonuclease/clavin/mitogillin